MLKSLSGYITLSILFLITVISLVWYFGNPSIGEAEKESPLEQISTTTPRIYTGRNVLIHTNQMFLELRDGTNTLKTIPLVSVGKPGSYYETIGGVYLSDYKELSHFSSIGHVFMPYSVHLFGNYFIHGIPYYPDGTKVSSAYSGGCIRVADEDIQEVYDFISRGTPIIITEKDESEFSPSSTSTQTLESIDMTRLMVATISLEFLTQDNEIVGTDGISTTTRRTLLPALLQGDDTISKLYTQPLGQENFVMYMNQKATSIGLTNTTFSDVLTPSKTTEEDHTRFMEYMNTYKSYLLRLATTTPVSSQ